MAELPPRRNAGLALDVRGLRIVRAERGRIPRILLDVASLEIPAQAQVAILGPPLSGKSRLLRVLAALEQPDRGSIWWGAVNVVAMDPMVAARWRRATLSIVGSGFPLLRSLSAYRNVLLPPSPQQWRVSPPLRAHARALLDLAGIPEHTRLAALAPPDARRVALVRALVRSPSIVLADDPAAGLPHGDSAAVLHTLRMLAACTGATLIMTTRDADLAARLDVCYELAGLTLRRAEVAAPGATRRNGLASSRRGTGPR